VSALYSQIRFLKLKQKSFVDGLLTPPTSPRGPAFPLHFLLIYDPSLRVRCDVSRDVSNVQLRPGMLLSTLDEYASSPPTQRMSVNIPGLPWNFEVASARGITVRDVLAKLCETMDSHVGNTEFQLFDLATRNLASASFMARGRNGMRRFDFVSGTRCFAGLIKARDGFSWDAFFV
jgi:hypothetical protein